jgi:hypothetical protein
MNSEILQWVAPQVIIELPSATMSKGASGTVESTYYYPVSA